MIGAGDYIGAAIAKKFAAEGFIVFAGRRNGDKLAPLVSEVEARGGRIVGRALARLMLPRGRGSIFFTGATASLRGSVGYVAFPGA